MLKKELISNIYTEQEKKINDETILRIAFSSRCNGIVSNLSYCVRCGKNNEISNQECPTGCECKIDRNESKISVMSR